jgi:hypothetical protein
MSCSCRRAWPSGTEYTEDADAITARKLVDGTNAPVADKHNEPSEAPDAS